MVPSRKILSGLLVLTILFLIVSCSTPRPVEKTVSGEITYLDNYPAEKKDKARREVSLQMFEGLRNYKLLPGDVLKIMYLINPGPEDKQYRIKVGDRLKIESDYGGYEGSGKNTRRYCACC
ncbi:MAG: hypothetical protein JRI45_04935 [Deltaproteobacteria bacterium]|nr:hypothetical protein [Deltaproteobacteria bacterium]